MYYFPLKKNTFFSLNLFICKLLQVTRHRRQRNARLMLVTAKAATVSRHRSEMQRQAHQV
jgi:hypothetical protein